MTARPDIGPGSSPTLVLRLARIGLSLTTPQIAAQAGCGPSSVSRHPRTGRRPRRRRPVTRCLRKQRRDAAQRHGTAADMPARLAVDVDPLVGIFAAGNPNCPTSAVAPACCDAYANHGAARNPNRPPPMLAYVATAARRSVRAAAGRPRRYPPAALRRLAADADTAIAAAAWRRLAPPGSETSGGR